MAVNDELPALEAGLAGALARLAVGGRLAVIAYHSIEDRCCKRFIAAHVQRQESLPGGGSRRVGELPAVRRVTRRPVTPSAEECRINPRSRSARLRVAEKTTIDED
jgi:16S rRNA (cytosine1402-N4)-methyltransferase